MARIEKLEGDVNDLETEIAGLTAKLQGYRTEMAGPLAQGLTAEEEELIEDLGREIEQRQRQLLELGRTKNEVRNLLVICAWLTEGPSTVRQAQEYARDRAE